MKTLAIAGVCLALSLLTFFQFPGHTWLQQDSQIYLPILEHLRDPSLLRNDILVQHPHVAFTLYDETALALRRATGRDFHDVLASQQLATRALGIWGLLLMAEALGLAFAPAFLVAALCSLGAAIPGPAVLTFEYEPTPRAFAVPLLLCAIGLLAHRRYLASGIAASAAFLYHPPTALPFWGAYCVLALWPHRKHRRHREPSDHREPSEPSAPNEHSEHNEHNEHRDRRERLAAFLPLAAACLVLAAAAHAQSVPGEGQHFFARLDATQQFLEHTRTAYVWISTWSAAAILHHLLILAAGILAFLRLRLAIPAGLRVFLPALATLAVLSLPLSWLLLEHFQWGLVPQVQPLRTLLFLTLGAQFLTAAAGARALLGHRPVEAFPWFAFAYLLPLQPLLTGPWACRRAALALALAALTALAGMRLAPAVSLAAFFAIPLLGGVVNYPRLLTPPLAELNAWARTHTPRDAVFAFPAPRRSLVPGIFRGEALRAVYVDWKGGGQVNYLPSLGELWWFRWQQTRDFHPADLPRYQAMGVAFIVLPYPLGAPPAFHNSTYFVYPVR